jgi:aspartyl-tRNA(Asn)/glutamyl-tRNA(Gln) amidotransferase subunit C
MVSERDVAHIAELADLGIDHEELVPFTRQFNAILDYFDILDRAPGGEPPAPDLVNVMREDEPGPSLPVEDVLRNAGAAEDGFIKAPKVMQ